MLRTGVAHAVHRAIDFDQGVTQRLAALTRDLEREPVALAGNAIGDPGQDRHPLVPPATSDPRSTESRRPPLRAFLSRLAGRIHLD